ncbi:MAG: hypothetical protein JXR40_00380 [Pontiellaceae bacterium]|nr:hypothetical protein [Pontiellaceae bacterium]
MTRLWISLFLLSTAAKASAGLLAPFYEAVEANGVRMRAVRPFYSSVETEERWEKDYLWPLYVRKGFKDEEYARFFVVGWHNDFSSGEGRERTWVLPIYFQGRAADGENYFGLFPLGGHLRDFLGRDRIDFALFPLWARSQVNEVKTTSVLWPIYSRTQGDGVDRFRIWPLYGESTLEGSYQKKFVLWPIFSSVKYTNPGNPGGGFILFPLYGHVQTEKGDNHWILPPFFRFAEGGGQRIINAPWPFIQLSDGDVYKRYLWPLYGKKQAGSSTQKFWLWPVIWDRKTELGDRTQERFNVMPFFYSEKEVLTKAVGEAEVGDTASKYWKVWPLMSWDQRGETSRFRLLDLWPMRETDGVERNWAPLWTLYRRMENDGAVQHRLLWGIYEQEKGKGSAEWSLLKGLVKYKKTERGSSFRVLFFRFGNAEK